MEIFFSLNQSYCTSFSLSTEYLQQIMKKTTLNLNIRYNFLANDLGFLLVVSYKLTRFYLFEFQHEAFRLETYYPTSCLPGTYIVSLQLHLLSLPNFVSNSHQKYSAWPLGEAALLINQLKKQNIITAYKRTSYITTLSWFTVFFLFSVWKKNFLLSSWLLSRL